MATLNRMTTAHMDEINGINVVVCIPTSIQHLLQPSVNLVTNLEGYDGERKKEREVVPCSSMSQHTMLVSLCMYTPSKCQNNLNDSCNLLHCKEHNRRVSFQFKLLDRYVWPLHVLLVFTDHLISVGILQLLSMFIKQLLSVLMRNCYQSLSITVNSVYQTTIIDIYQRCL